MFVNEKYKWMLDWEAPKHTLLPKALYWANLYQKIYNQGTMQDRMKLEKLYYYYHHTNSIIDKVINIFFTDSGADHKRACIDFINEVVGKAREDDYAHQREVRERNRQMERYNRLSKEWNIDMWALQSEAEILEKELETKHTKEQKIVQYKNGIFCSPERPTTEEILSMPIIKSGTCERSYINKYGKKVYYNIFWNVRDMCKGFYTIIAFTDDENYQEYCGDLGALPKAIYFGNTLTGEYGVFNWEHGIGKILYDVDKGINKYNDMVIDEWILSDGGRLPLVDNASKKKISSANKSKKTAKSDDVDIDKINKALGLGENDDLDGNAIC